ncbi:MAG TPA: bifunctional diaminohydroxyphosphoribosylaminopyrimidine deaminase/5-amino-6-(5-phosphoribosylamino)uracil reductase RibD [Longimicrobiales bacterium]|nr:bifunctional diaminohydroxyphosphoribosylaminopyrimidine deaminase/5-amino-6-(5-phosphoribosylamino)uracil reductase RibD [Longimicrobiales bacterium]
MAKPDLSGNDAAHLERARALAASGWGFVHPNPLVGCVLVRDGEVVGEGYHKAFGGPHAEIVALESALTRAEGATAYVSLEPCNHQGKTPPCTQALLRAGVRRVVFGASDAGPGSGGGARALAAAGIDVVGPCWTPQESRAENPAFFHAARHATPYVAVKLAQTLDGRIAQAPGRRTPITGEEANVEVHRLRTGFDAILVGGVTARVDDPLLTVRLVPPGRVPPRRLVLDPDATLPSDAALLRDARDAPVHVFTRADVREGELERLEGAGAHVHPVEGHGGLLDLDAVQGVCAGLGIGSILCEGGGRLATSLLVAGIARRLYLFIAPCTLGPSGVAAFDADPGTLGWGAFRPAFPPRLHGRDTLLVLDREER